MNVNVFALADFHTVSPALMSTSATLWPIGTSILEVRLNDELSWVTTQSMSVPALRPSTTTTPTVSFFSWTRRCGAPKVSSYEYGLDDRLVLYKI